MRRATFNIANGDVAGLKAAIIACRTNGQNDVINLAASGVYTLTTVDNATNGSNGLPLVIAEAQHSVTINGNGATLQRSTSAGVPGFRILNLSCDHPFCTSLRTTINDLTIANGVGTDPASNIAGFGGGIYVENVDVDLVHCALTQNIADRRGGGIFNSEGSVGIYQSSFSQNRCSEGGGAIANGSALTVVDTTFDGNRSGSAPGAAILNLGAGVMAAATFTSCTFNNNVSGGNTGGVFNNFVSAGNVATIVFTHCTFRLTDLLNSGQYTGGPAPTATIRLRNSLFSGSTLTNYTNPGHTRVEIISEGLNLTSDNGGGYLTGPNDQINTDPKLDPAGLQDNGGRNQTIALGVGSPALDHGSAFGIATDQRGNFRTRDLSYIANGPGTDGTDVGALEAAEPKQGGPAYTVNTLTDHDDGFCGQIDCTLREAVGQSNNLTTGSGMISLASLSGTLTLNGTEIFVTRALQITGPGPRLLAISANVQSRVFSFLGPITCAMSDLTIRDGYVAGAAGASTVGGGIYNEGTLTLDRCALVYNRVVGGAAPAGAGTDGGSARGGAIFNGTSLTLNGCTLGGANANSAIGGNGSAHTNDGVIYIGGRGGAGLGGAIYNDTNGTLVMNNTTVNGNSATGGTGGAGTNNGAGGSGGQAVAGIFNTSGMTVTGSTITANTGTGGAGGHGTFQNGANGKGIGGIRAESGTSTLRNSLVALNTRNQSGGPDVDGTFASGGYNLIGIGDFSTGFNQTGDQVGTTAAAINPQLGILQNNGGPTDTRALLSNSPAIDQGKAFGLTTDQRGMARTVDQSGYANSSGGDGTDIGAFELEATAPPAVLSAVSRKTHGSAGTFDISLPLTGTPGIECRSGASHLVVVTFAQTITLSGVSVTGGASATYSVSGSAVTVTLTPNDSFPKRLILTLEGVNSAGDIAIPMNILLGDTNSSGGVSASDVSQTKGASGQTASASSFRTDVNVSGSTSASDISLVKSASGSQLPAGANPARAGTR